jgi:hypothetical protein
MLTLGVVLTVLGFFVLNRLLLLFPPLANFYKVIQVSGIVLLVASVYLKGGYGTEMEWREQVADLKKKILIAEQKSKEVNVNVQERVVTKIKVIKEKGKTIYIDRPAIIEFDKTCPLPKEVFEIHNEAADMNIIVEKKFQGAKK